MADAQEVKFVKPMGFVDNGFGGVEAEMRIESEEIDAEAEQEQSVSIPRKNAFFEERFLFKMIIPGQWHEYTKPAN